MGLTKAQKEERIKLANKVAEFVTLNASKSAMEKQLEVMKKEIATMVEPYASQFVDGEWIVLHPESMVRVGTIKATYNNPKLVKIDSDEAPDKKALAKLLKAMPKRYLVAGLNLSLIRESEKDDENLVSILSNAGVNVVRPIRYDIKS